MQAPTNPPAAPQPKTVTKKFGRLLLQLRIAPKGDRLWQIATSEGFTHTQLFAFTRAKSRVVEEAHRHPFYIIFCGPLAFKWAVIPKMKAPTA